jgi:asparagine synthase (glutamine-hydrolysing)
VFSMSTHFLTIRLRDAVREHLRSDVPVGIWLSGGLDSSTILHYVCESGVRHPTTLSVAFESRCCDESRYFREMAARYETDHHEFTLGATSNLIPAVERLTFYSDEPGADAGALPVWFLSQLTSHHVTVALSGDGGDELFGGYVTYLADRVGHYLRLTPAIARRLTWTGASLVLPNSDRKIGFEYKVKRLLEGSLLSADDAHMFWNGAFSPEQRRKLLLHYPPVHPALELWRKLPPALEVGELNRYMLFDQQAYLPDNILYKVDRISMAHSIEVRPAFLDHRIVEFAASLPQRMKIRGTSGKYLLKQTMKGKLPPSVLNRSKQGFDIPTHEWFRGVLKPLLLDTLSETAVVQSQLFDWEYIRRLIKGHMERRFNIGYHLWGLMTVHLGNTVSQRYQQLPGRGHNDVTSTLRMLRQRPPGRGCF